MPLTTVAAATKLLSDAMSALNAVREHAKRSKDAELKQHISTLYDNLLSLKEALMRLTDENNELKRRIVELERIPEKPAPELRQVGAVNYYFVGEKGPYCQLCYDGPRGKLVALTPVENWNDGLRRHCVVCNKYFYEKPMDQEPAIGIISDPNGWMGR